MINKRKENRGVERKICNESIAIEMSGLGRVKGAIQENAVGVDVTSYGLGLITSSPLPKGAVIKCLFPVRSLAISIPVFAQVLWTVPLHEHSRVGLRFLG